MNELDTGLAAMRAFAESTMKDTCRVVQLGALVYNPATDTEEPSETEIYAGPCTVRVAGDAQAQDSQIGGQRADVYRYLVKLPAGTTGIRPEHMVTDITSSDPELTGTMLIVRSVDKSTYLTARRLGCEEYSQ